MAFSSCISLPFSSSSASASSLSLLNRNKSFSSELCVASSRFGFRNHWSFIGGSRIALLPNAQSNTSVFPRKLNTSVQASWFTTSQIASSMFTLGTTAVIPFYTLMVFAPKAKLTKKCMESNLPYVALSVLYGYLLYLSWTPDTLKYMFYNKYFMPELPGIAKMFSSEITLASAWIHILLVDLFAARQVFNDGLENQIETRHSVSLCLLFCPFGIISHVVTKALTNNNK